MAFTMRRWPMAVALKVPLVFALHYAADFYAAYVRDPDGNKLAQFAVALRIRNEWLRSRLSSADIGERRREATSINVRHLKTLATEDASAVPLVT